VVKDGPGFLVNRLLMFYMTEAMWLLDEGHRIEDIDRAMTDWGMPVGPMALADEVGLDVAAKVAHILGDAFGDRLPLPIWLDRLSETDRLGAKTGAGFYLYEKGKRAQPDPEGYRRLGLAPDAGQPDPSKLVERMVLPMVNEAGRCLEEGVVGSAGELDLAMIMGTGFPPFRGGLCRWADRQGLGELSEIMAGLAAEVGERLRPSSEFAAAAEGGGFYEHFG
jgi:3-hydroxyacyl-CoA dehydrogenase/enoyl-CoA hydratase/3-hydroxybutyryl-CoA epimerase